MRLITIFIFSLLLTSCGVQFKYGVYNTAGHIDGIYNSSDSAALEILNDTKIDTITSFSDFKWKLRTDFNFRWDFAQYAMNQPYSWYWNNPRLDGIWRPYNRFDVYFYSNFFWTDWAMNYPFSSWGWNNWNYPYYYYGWYRPYRPWHNFYNNSWYNTNIIWNTSRRGTNVAFVNGRRGSNIETTINNNRRVRNYPNKPLNNVNTVINSIRNNNSNIRINNNSNSNNLVIPNNNSNNISRPRYNSNNNNNYYSRPPVNFSRSNNISRSNNSSRSSSGGRSTGVIKQR